MKVTLRRMADIDMTTFRLSEQTDAISADLLRVPINALDGRPTPSRVREVQDITDAGLLREAVGRHLVEYGRIDDVSWELIRPLRASRRATSAISRRQARS